MNIQAVIQKVIAALDKHQVEYMLIGGFAVNFYGYMRATNDIDIWIKPTNENFFKLTRSVGELGYEEKQLNELVFDPKKTFVRVNVDGLDVEFLAVLPGETKFSEAVSVAERVAIGSSKVYVISYDHLIKNKIATNRPKDVSDVHELKRLRGEND